MYINGTIGKKTSFENSISSVLVRNQLEHISSSISCSGNPEDITTCISEFKLCMDNVMSPLFKRNLKNAEPSKTSDKYHTFNNKWFNEECFIKRDTF